MAHSFQTIQYSVSDGTATIVMNRPDYFNSFTEEMNKEIIYALRQADKDSEVRSIIVTGAGKAFCAGEDLGGVDEGTNHADFLRKRYHPMMETIQKTTKPIIAAVNGTAAGAGMSLVLAADFRLMKPDIKLVSAFMNIGLIPDSGFLYMLPRIVGYAKAMEIAVLGKVISGQEAYELGLATEVIPSAEWEERVAAFAAELSSLPTASFSLIKRYMLDSMHESYPDYLEKEAQAQRIAGLTEDHQEGLHAFKEKRKPMFKGK